MTRLAALLASLAFTALSAMATTAPARADGCYICKRGSTCGQYCRHTGRDSWAKRKKCIAAGCKIGGTASCPTAANVRICSGVGLLRRSGRQYAEDSPRPGVLVPWSRAPGAHGWSKICVGR